MTVQELARWLNARNAAPGTDETAQVHCGYAGDLLSWVMSRAQEGDAWLTVMGNVNSIGVAVLADVACIILTENAALDEEALKRAEQNGVIILTTGKNSYRVAAEISRLN